MDLDNLIHKDIMKDDRWIKMPLWEQIGNIGAETARMVHWKKKGNKKQLDSAWDRALELIDLTIYGLQKQGCPPALKEILLYRDVLCDWAGDFGIYGEDGEKLVKYCTDIVLMHRK